ncbi:MAG: hypothetical protein HY052_07390 [Proteobacteria bacterium]|nr:hypothetical protein [Pseudomonadota bacterium]
MEVYDNACAFSLRDRDNGIYEIDNKQNVIRFRLQCYAAENLILADETLSLLGTDWTTMQSGIRTWLQSEGSRENPKYAEVQTFVNNGFNRDSERVKELKNFFMHIAGSAKPWEVAVGQAIAGLDASSPETAGSLRAFLGQKAVEALGLCR